MRHHFLTPARLLFVVLVLAVAAAVGTAQQPRIRQAGGSGGYR